ncbi:MAG: hypothetical protein KDD36_00545 [Flavobacteriales bacterium]|nr:hypothetical protein [Flavobacteriales bacterium]
MKNLLPGIALALAMLMAGCAKDELIVVPDNIVPPDPTVSDLPRQVIMENYINKLYISVLGRKPSSAELATGLTILQQNDLSMADREQLVEIILSSNEYYARAYDLARIELLNGLDTAQITQDIFIYNLLLQDTATYGPYFPAIKAEIARLEALQDVPVDFPSGQINMIGVHRRCVDNAYYDDINMGTENFVVSMFQNFLLRYPTQTELAEASKIVDGFTGTLFYQIGENKADFLTIFFASSGYFEGQVRNLFQRYLFKDATSEQMSSLSAMYQSNSDYKALQKTILSMDEFVGLKN